MGNRRLTDGLTDMGAVAAVIKEVATVEAGVQRLVGCYLTDAEALALWEANKVEFARVGAEVVEVCSTEEKTDLAKTYLLTANLYLGVLHMLKQQLVEEFAKAGAAPDLTFEFDNRKDLTIH